MAELRYAVILEPDEQDLQVIVPAFPEIHTFGRTAGEALEMARDAIELSISHRREEGLDVPKPDADRARLESVAIESSAA